MVLLKLLRPKHWIKNGFVLAPIIFSMNFMNEVLLIKTLYAFISFCAVASSIYIINDIIDRKNDQKHPKKKNRPIASGKISVGFAAIISVFLLGGGLYLANTVNEMTTIIIGIYFLVNLGYSTILKHYVMIDVLLIAVGFLLRVYAGAAAIDVSMSQWIILTTFFISLFLGFAKRRNEIIVLQNKSHHRPVLEDYSVGLLDELINISLTLTIIAYSLYVIDPLTALRFHTDKLFLTIPFVAYGMFRYLYLIHKKNEGGDPVEIVVKDPGILFSVISWGCVTIGILYLENQEYLQ